MKITTDTTADDIRSKWGASITRETMREGSARRGRLQSLARMRSRDFETTLSLDPELGTAYVDQQADGGPAITVTAREVDQPVTDYGPEAWDWLVQRAMTMHEVGHIKYTDHSDFMARLDDIEADYKGTAKQIWNALEDGAIEVQIRRRWPNYSLPLLHMRANLFADNQPGIPDPEKGGHVVPMASAIFTGCLDLATYNSGVYRQLLDEDDDEFHFASSDDEETFKDIIAPRLADLVPRVLSEPVSAKRNAYIFDFLEFIKEYIDNADGQGGKSMMNRDEGHSGGMPDDASDSHTGGAEANADALDDETGDEAAERVKDIVGDSGTADPSEVDSEDDGPTAPVDPDGTLDSDDDTEPTDSAAGGADSDADDDEDAGGSDVLETDRELESEMREDVADQRSDESGMSETMNEELRNLLNSMAGGEELENDTLYVPEGGDGDGDRDRFNRYKANSKRFAQLLRQRLQKERKTKTRRNTRRGRIDGSNLHRVHTGAKGVKKRKEKPDEKDYAFVLIEDGSGSMSGPDIKEAEETTVTIGTALESVGVDVMVIRLLSNRAVVTKPFGVPFDQRVEHTVNAKTGGSTPLAQCIRLGRERLKQYPSDAQRAMMVITDGSPNNDDEYSEALDRCVMPVIGVQLTDGSGAGEEYYHRYVTAQPGSGELQSQLRTLVQEAMDL